LLRAIGEGWLLRRRDRIRDLRMSVTTSDAASDLLWTELHERLRGFVGRRIGDPHAADDIAQDVLLRLHRSIGDLRVDDRLDAFAYRIARNAIIDHYRSRASAKETPAEPDYLAASIDADGDSGQDPDADGPRQELARCLAPLIRELPEPYREALTLTDLGELSQVEAAEVAGLSVPGMKARVQRARTQVHELLTGCCAVALDQSRHITDVQRTGPCACPPEMPN
jgi:RNA polymerase sigma-70 factor, ECF subfamily